MCKILQYLLITLITCVLYVQICMYNTIVQYLCLHLIYPFVAFLSFVCLTPYIHTYLVTCIPFVYWCWEC